MKAKKISKTVNILQDNKKDVKYVVIKIDNKIYSTKFVDRDQEGIHMAREQITDTENLGAEENIWIKGWFSETNNHNKLDKEIPFELNIYSEVDNNESNR